MSFRLSAFFTAVCLYPLAGYAVPKANQGALPPVNHPLASDAPITPYEQACARLANPAAGSDSDRFKQLLDLYWNQVLRDYPESATYSGFPGYDTLWTDYSPAAVALRERENDAPWQALHTIQRDKLGPEDQTSYDLLQWEVEMARAGRAFGDDVMPLSQMSGLPMQIPNVLAAMPAKTVQDYKNILARLKAIPRLAQQTEDLLAVGLARGYTFPAMTLRAVPQQIASLYEPKPAQSRLLEPFQNIPADLAAQDREQIKALEKEAEGVYRDAMTPALRKLRDYVATTYTPGSRPSDGWSSLPQGKDWYAYEVKRNTTTDLNPDQIHRLGQEQVKKIHAEMERTMRQTGFHGSIQEFAKKLVTDPKYQFKTKQDLLAAFGKLFAEEKSALPRLFGKYIPVLPLKVEPVPQDLEKSQAPAYYEAGSAETHRPGTFFVNTYDLPSRGSWNVPDLGLHEGIPGHHFQISLAQENKGLPNFRKYATGDYSAFVEGWALYAESLGDELGVYKTPEETFGREIADSWRAVRLVVDTGLHAKGWTRQQAIDYFRKNAPLPDSTIIPEVDRYMVMPGQALSYMVGKLKFRELRDYAQSQLGKDFDLPEFHHQALQNGALPLNVLDQKIRAWVASKKAAAQ